MTVQSKTGKCLKKKEWLSGLQMPGDTRHGADAVEPELIDNQQIRAGVAAQACWQSLVGQRCRQIGQQGGRGAIQNSVTVHTGLLSDGLDYVTLANPAPAGQEQIVPAPNEIAGGQLDQRKLSIIISSLTI